MNFDERVYELVSKIPEGKVTTYRELANTLGTSAYRAVGQALRRNPNPSKEVPCHRVIASSGELGGYGGDLQRVPEKAKLLESEGIIIQNGIIDLKRFMHRF